MQNLEVIRLKELSVTLWSIIDDLHQAGNDFKMWLNLAESTMTVPKLFCGPMKVKWNNLEGPCSTTSGTAYHDNIIPTVKYGGGNILTWACSVWNHWGHDEFSNVSKKKSWSECLPVSWNAADIGWGHRTETQNAGASPQRTASRQLLDWPDQSPNFDPVKILWNIGRELYQWDHQGHDGESSSAMNTLLKSSWKMYRSYPYLQEGCFCLLFKGLDTQTTGRSVIFWTNLAENQGISKVHILVLAAVVWLLQQLELNLKALNQYGANDE